MVKRLSTAGVRREYKAYRCNRYGFEEISILGRAPVRVIDLWVPAWKALEATLVHAGYPQAEIVSSYACRPIRDRILPSLHSYRMAIDIDPRRNSRQWRLDYSKILLSRAQIGAVESIRTRDGWQVFRSGIHFRHIDPMHFQGAAPISSILTGIEGVTVATHHHHEGHTVTHHHSEHGTTTGPALPTLKRGSRGQSVRNLQGLLEAHGEHIRIDGTFGRATKQAVIHMQKAHHLAADGIVGRRSWKALLR